MRAVTSDRLACGPFVGWVPDAGERPAPALIMESAMELSEGALAMIVDSALAVQARTLAERVAALHNRASAVSSHGRAQRSVLQVVLKLLPAVDAAQVAKDSGEPIARI
jgi:hypothetical protein